MAMVTQVAGRTGKRAHGLLRRVLMCFSFTRKKVSFFRVASQGRSSEELISGKKSSGCFVNDWARGVMNSPAFITTDGRNYKSVIIRGDEFEDDDRSTWRIREKALKLGYRTPLAEVAPLLEEQVTDQDIREMDLWGLVVMHEPILVGGHPFLLSFRKEPRFFGVSRGTPHALWSRRLGFVFLAPTE